MAVSLLGHVLQLVFPLPLVLKATLTRCKGSGTITRPQLLMAEAVQTAAVDASQQQNTF